MSAWPFFYAARISRPVLHCPVLPSAPNCPLLALTPKTIDTGPLSFKVFHISKELLASHFVHLNEGFMLILPLGKRPPQLFSMPLPTPKLETPCKCARQQCRYKHSLIKSIRPVNVCIFQMASWSESKRKKCCLLCLQVSLAGSNMSNPGQ